MNPWVYSILHLFNHFVIYFILFLLILFSMISITNLSSDVTTVDTELDESLETISNNEIFIHNAEQWVAEGDKYYYSQTQVISKETIKNITEIEHVKKVYPYHAIWTYSYVDFLHGKNLKKEELNQIESNTKTISIEDVGLMDSLVVATCDGKEKAKHSVQVDDSLDHGVFISKELASALNIESLNQTDITFYLPVIIGYFPSTMNAIYEDGTQSDDMKTDITAIYYEKMSFKIKGIYEENLTSNYYDSIQAERIFIDAAEYMNYTEKYLNDDSFVQQYLASFKEDTIGMETQLQLGFYSNSYIVDVDKNENVKSVLEVLQNMQTKDNDVLYSKTKGIQKDQITSVLDKANKPLYTSILIQGGIGLLILEVLYVFILHTRKKEIAYLKTNGLRFSHQYPVISILYISIFTIPLVYWFCSKQYGYSILNQIPQFIILIVFLILCIITNHLYFKKINIINQLRSK